MFAVLGREPAELTKSARQRDTGNRFFSIAVDQLLPSADKPQAAYPSMRRGVEEPAKVSFERARVDISNLREVVEVNAVGGVEGDHFDEDLAQDFVGFGVGGAEGIEGADDPCGNYQADEEAKSSTQPYLNNRISPPSRRGRTL